MLLKKRQYFNAMMFIKQQSFLTMTYKRSSLFSLYLNFHILVPTIQEAVNIFSKKSYSCPRGTQRGTRENDLRSEFEMQMLGLFS